MVLQTLAYTKSLARYVLNLARFMTIFDISKHLGLSWDLIKSIQKRYLQKKHSCPDLSELEQIAIDEIYTGKRGYLTVVLDIQSGAVVFVGDGKGSEALEPFWARLRRYRKVKVEAVVMGMSPAYIKAVKENLQKAVIVFDHFRVIKMMNEKISDFRMQLHSITVDRLQRSVLKGTRWLLLTPRENLETKDKSVERLRQALEVNKPLATVYYMKEDLRQIWGWGSDRQATEWHLKSSREMAKKSGISMLLKFAKTLEKHLDGHIGLF